MSVKKGMVDVAVYMIVGALFLILNTGVGLLLTVFSTQFPLGDFGKAVLVIITVTINGVLVIIVAGYQRTIRGKVTPVLT